MPPEVWLLAGALIAGIAVWNLRPEAVPPLARVTLTTAPNTALWISSHGTDLAISPDGTQVVFAARTGSTTQLYLRRLDSLKATPVRGTTGLDGAVINPFFSPDGRELYYCSDQNLRKVTIDGTDGPSTVSEGIVFGGSWGTDGTFVFAEWGTEGGLYGVPGNGGERTLLAAPQQDSGEVGYAFPQVLPGNKAVVFNICLAQGCQIAALDLTTGDRRVLVSEGVAPHYVTTGHIVFARRNDIVAVPIDVPRLETRGQERIVVENVHTKNSGAANFSVSRNGTLAYVQGQKKEDLERRRSLVWVDFEGNEEVLDFPTGEYLVPRISPDGRQIVVGIFESGASDIWLYDLEDITTGRISRGMGIHVVPQWTLDGRRIVFSSQRDASFDLYWKPVRGGRQAELLATGPNDLYANSWSPDGRLLVYTEHTGTKNRDVGILSLDGNGERTRLLNEAFNESAAAVSPDGAWIAYQSDASGSTEILVRPFPNVQEALYRVARDGSFPLWAPDGRALYFCSSDQMISVPLRTRPEFTWGNPVVLFEFRGRFFHAEGRQFDIAPGGKRFLMLRREIPSSEPRNRSEITLFLNWGPELKRLVPMEGK